MGTVPIVSFCKTEKEEFMFIRIIKVCSVAISFCFIAGCVSVPPSDNTPIPEPDMANANFGSYPTNYEELIFEWARMNLKDSESARYQRISIPRKEYMIHNRQPFYGYSSCVIVNGKNSYGAYTGNQAYWFMFRDGKIARWQRIDSGFPGKLISIDHYANCEDGQY